MASKFVWPPLSVMLWTQPIVHPPKKPAVKTDVIVSTMVSFRGAKWISQPSTVGFFVVPLKAVRQG